MKLPLRADLEGLEPYGAPQLPLPVTINVNENPYPPTPEVCAAIAQAAGQAAAGLNRYPDREFTALREALSGYVRAETGVSVAPEHIWAGNGSNEVMHHLFLAFGGPGQPALSAAPTYSMYHEYARTTLTPWETIPRREDFSLDVDALITRMRQVRPGLVVLASPNNPTGAMIADLEDIRKLARAAAESGPGGAATVLVIDEAYGEFRRPGRASAAELLGEFPHLAVSRTMSKAFGAAGLRLGYLLADPQIIDCLRLVRLPYHLSAITQAVAVALLSHQTEQLRQVASLREGRDAMAAALSEMGLRVAESDANFVMFGVFPDPHLVWEELKNRGVLIRHVGPEGYLRASVGTPEENQAFLNALGEVLEGRK